MAKRRKKSGGILAEFTGAWHDVKQDYTKFLTWNAKRRTTNNKLKTERVKARKTIASEKAVKAARKRGEKARRVSDAEKRRAANRTTPVTTYQPIPSAPTRPRPVAPSLPTAQRPQQPAPGARPCGAKTDDGSPCQILVGAGGKCAIGSHRPKSAPTATQRPAHRLRVAGAQERPSQPRATANVASEGHTRIQVGRVLGQPVNGGGGTVGKGAPRRERRAPDGPTTYTNYAAPGASVGQQVGHIDGPLIATATGQPSARITGPGGTGATRRHDGTGKPLTPESREFFRLREDEGWTGPIRWDKGQLPYKCDENGNRVF